MLSRSTAETGLIHGHPATRSVGICPGPTSAGAVLGRARDAVAHVQGSGGIAQATGGIARDQESDVAARGHMTETGGGANRATVKTRTTGTGLCFLNCCVTQLVDPAVKHSLLILVANTRQKMNIEKKRNFATEEESV